MKFLKRKVFKIVNLDKQSMQELKDSVRKEVIEEIKKSGNTYSEIVYFLINLSSEGYFNIIKDTLPDILDKTNETDIVFLDEKIKYKKLKIISDLLEI